MKMFSKSIDANFSYIIPESYQLEEKNENELRNSRNQKRISKNGRNNST